MSVPKSLALLPKYHAPSSWWEHVPIAHWVVEILKPATIVELGTHYGVSFFSFCEAAEHYSPNTYIYAVDTWEGDAQAGFYENNVYKKVFENKEKNHSQRSSMMRCTFEQAASQFSERTLDLIHIDGLHTYEAVKNDFEIWKNKLKENGTIMFHDWNVRERDFGVWKLWDEIKNDSNYQCIETPNGYGLGLATFSKTKPIWHEEFEKNKTLLVTKGKLLHQLQQEREKFMVLKQDKNILKQHANNLEAMHEEDSKHLNAIKSRLREADKIIEALKERNDQLQNQRIRNWMKNKWKKFMQIGMK